MRTVLTAETKQAVEVKEVILLQIQFGDLCVRVWSGVVPLFVVPLLSETLVIDRFVKEIFLKERKIFPEQSTPVAIRPTFKSTLIILADATKSEGEEEGMVLAKRCFVSQSNGTFLLSLKHLSWSINEELA